MFYKKAVPFGYSLFNFILSSIFVNVSFVFLPRKTNFMKVIIPVAGAGIQLRPHTHTQPKPLIPVAGKPILGHIVDRLIEAGIHDFIFVIGYLGDKIVEFIRSEYENKLVATFVVQEPRLGLAHAISLCQSYVEHDEELLISLGDIIVDVPVEELIFSSDNILAVHKVDNPSSFGIALLNDSGYIKSLVEKPDIPKSNLALVGLYKIVTVHSFFESLRYIMTNGIKSHQEFHLTDVLMHLINQGIQIKACTVKRWFDCGHKEVLLESNRLLLKNSKYKTSENHLTSVIIPPVFIHPTAKLQNSIIGPNVAIGENARIKNSILEDSIVGAYSQLSSIILKSSIVGNDSSLTGRSQSVNIGDNTDIDFND